MVIGNSGIRRVELAVSFRLRDVGITVHFCIRVTMNLWGMAVRQRGAGNGRQC